MEYILPFAALTHKIFVLTLIYDKILCTFTLLEAISYALSEWLCKYENVLLRGNLQHGCAMESVSKEHVTPKPWVSIENSW